MKLERVKKLKPIERLAYWIKERESIRLKKEAGEPKPWTDDTILQNYRFCNVRRMDDKVSQWLLNNWYLPNFDHPNMLVAVTMARFFNNPFALEAIGFPNNQYRPSSIKKKLRKARELGTIWNAAYMVRGNDGEDKISSVIDYTVTPLRGQEKLLVDTDSMQQTWINLSQCYGFGSFMAGQVVADLRWALSGKWGDKFTWAPIGPGSKKGMNLLQGRPATQPLGQAQFLYELLETIHKLSKLVPVSIMSRLECHDAQNCMCEMFKFEKTLQGIGKPKQRYPGHAL